MGKSREEEHKLFLSWLIETIENEKIDLLIVAGDIFDTGTPPNYARELYYNVLKSLLNSSCSYIVVVAGNHDSVSTLKAPQALLEMFNIFVIASGEERQQLIEIHKNKELQAVVCAVPFLRDAVVKKSFSGETMNEKEYSVNEGIKKHYTDVYQKALTRRANKEIPIIATGHLTTVGSKSSESEREIYIGGTLDIDSDFLGSSFDYVALGHLHINQKVQQEHVRYSGSPIALSFSEASSQKKVNIIEFVDKEMSVKELNIPTFRALIVLRGNLEEIETALALISDKQSWIEIHLNDENPYASNKAIRDKAETLDLIILAIKIDKTVDALHLKSSTALSLNEFSPLEIFNKRLEQEELEDEALKEALNKEFKLLVEELITP